MKPCVTSTDFLLIYSFAVDSLPRGSPDSQKEMISPSGANREPQSPVVEDEDSSLGLKVDEDGSHENQGQVEGEGSPQTEEETTARGGE